MKRFFLWLAVGACVLKAAKHEDYKLEDKSPLHHVFSSDATLDADTVNGFVEVIGDSSPTIRVDGERIIRARDQAALEAAKKDVVVDLNEKNGTAQVYVNGPFRGNGRDDRTHEFHEHNERNYEVTYNFTIHVPERTGLRLYSVNGNLSAKDIRGTFDLHTVNGAVEMANISGAGRAYALNGGTKIQFRDNPTGECNLQSFNGKLEVTFPASLNANLKFKTFNGAVYTDFDGVTMPATPVAAQTEKKDGRFVFRGRDSYQAMKVGSGGPEIQLETFNGTIQIKKAR